MTAATTAQSTRTPVNPSEPIRTSAKVSFFGSMILTMIGDDCAPDMADGWRPMATPARSHRLSAIHVRHREGELRERAHGNTRRPLGHERPGLVGPRRAGDVDVSPRHVVDEFLQEECRGNRACRTAARVREVGNLAFQLFAILFDEGHRPQAIAGAIRDLPDAAHPRVGRAEDTA